MLSPVSTYFTADFCRPLVRRSPDVTRSPDTFAFFTTAGFLTVAGRFFVVGEGGDFGSLVCTLLFGFNGFSLRGAYGQLRLK